MVFLFHRLYLQQLVLQTLRAAGGEDEMEGEQAARRTHPASALSRSWEPVPWGLELHGCLLLYQDQSCPSAHSFWPRSSPWLSSQPLSPLVSVCCFFTVALALS